MSCPQEGDFAACAVSEGLLALLHTEKNKVRPPAWASNIAVRSPMLCGH